MMKRFNSILSYLIIASLLIACETKPGIGTATGFSAVSQVVQPNANTSMGRWEIWWTNLSYLASEKAGWQTVHAELLVENGTFAPAAPSIRLKDIIVLTNLSNTYPVTLYQSTGMNKKKTETIEFNSKLPHGFRIKREYSNKDTLTSYFVEGPIPISESVVSIQTPSYLGEITYKNFSTTIHEKDYVAAQSPNNSVDLFSIGKLEIGAFTRKEFYMPMFDRVSATITVTANASNSKKTIKFNLQYYPIGIIQYITNTNVITTNPSVNIADFIAGIPYTDAPDCKPILEVQPDDKKSSFICALIPHGATDIHFIILGDTCVIYETKVPNAAK